jgi:hypothetical protein
MTKLNSLPALAIVSLDDALAAIQLANESPSLPAARLHLAQAVEIISRLVEHAREAGLEQKQAP